MKPAPAAAPALFLDRDGTLMQEVHYCRDPALVVLYPGVPEALRRLKAAGFRLVIITNQSGIGRGYFTEAEYQAVHRELLRQLCAALPPGEAPLIDATYHCPDALPSPRRKPAPGMVLEAVRDLGLDPARSWFVGDKAVDVECGRRAGTRTILVRTGHGATEPEAGADFTAADLVHAAEIILGAEARA